MSGAPQYPQRPKFWAMKVIREMALSGAVQTMGQPAALLVTIVASVEDQKAYKAPPDFYNEQLLSLMAMRKWEALDRARKAAIDHGWLVYSPPPNGSRAPGIYWVQLPDHIREAYTPNGYHTPDHTPDHILQTDTVGGNSLPYPNTKAQQAAAELSPEEFEIAKAVRDSLAPFPGINLSESFWLDLINRVARCEIAQGVLDAMLREIERPNSTIHTPPAWIRKQFDPRLEAAKAQATGTTT